MNNLRKAKNGCIFDVNGNKFYDFSKNLVFGHSYKKLTTIVKNNISSSWSIYGSSVYHQRLRTLIKKQYGDKYYLCASLSLEEVFLQLMLLNDQASEIVINGDRCKKWFAERLPSVSHKDGGIKITCFDMAEYYLNDTYEDALSTKSESAENTILIHNYYWYPDNLEILPDSDIIILPSFFNGNFEYVLILMSQRIHEKYSSLAREISEIPSLYIASSLKLLNLIKQESNSYDIFIKHEHFKQKGRLFSYNTLDDKHVSELHKIYKARGILLTDKAPFYNYVPRVFDSNQRKRLQRILEC